MSDEQTHGPARRLVERANDLNEHARETASFGPERYAEWDKLFAAIAAHDAAHAALVQAAEAILDTMTGVFSSIVYDEVIVEQLRAALEQARGESHD